MKKFHEWLLKTERHRKFQVCITLGVITSTFIGYFMPFHGEFALAAGVATNLIWIWEQ